MKKFLILLLVCLMVACNKPQTENKQEEVPPQNTQQTEQEQPKLEETTQEVQQVKPESQTEENEEDDDSYDYIKCYGDPLCKAIITDNLNEIKELIKNGADVNKSFQCYSPLAAAVHKGNLDIVQELIKVGADVREQLNCPEAGKEWSYPLEIAASDKNYNIGWALLKADAYDLICNGRRSILGYNWKYEGENQLCKAIEAEDLQKVIKELKHEDINSKCSLESESECEFSALAFAMYRNNLNIVKELIKAGADVNKKIHCNVDYAGEGDDDFYYTPLYFAIEGGCPIVGAFVQKDIAEELLKSGADVNAIDTNGGDDNGKTILELTSDPEITQMLLKYGAKDTPLAAIVRNDLEKFNTLLKTASQEEKDAALIKTVQDNNISAVQELIKAGADINVNIGLDSYPFGGCTEGTPLSVALDKGYTEIAVLLKKHGAKDTMCAAIEGKDSQRVKYVIQQGTNVNKKYSYCWPFDCGDPIPIYHAIKYGNAEIVKELIKAGADLNVNVNLYGEKALTYAKEKGNTEIIELLKAAGAKE